MIKDVIRLVRHEARLLARNKKILSSNVVSALMIGGLMVLSIKAGNDAMLTGFFATVIMAAALAPSFNIAVHSLVGEKERGTMEVLLLLPVSRGEIVAAKLALALGLALLGIVVVMISGPAAIAVWGHAGQHRLLFNPLTVWVAIVLAPLTSAMCCLLVIVISGWATNTQAATNMSMVVTLPLALLLLGWMLGSIRVDATHLGLVTLTLVLLVLGLFRLCPAALQPHVLVRRRS